MPIKERGGNRALGRRTVMLQIIDEIGDLTTPKGNDDFRAQLSAAHLRWNQAQQDHAEVGLAHRALEKARNAGVLRFPGPVPPPPTDSTAAAASIADDQPWPDYSEVR